ncbi:MAG TPA: hypothetical protein VGM50_22660 [Gemmatimonadaceae bacterium]|jgi:alpha-tubulin suppressor-like RCC1 family protein
MRNRLILLGLAVFAAATLTACSNSETRDLVAPTDPSAMAAPPIGTSPVKPIPNPMPGTCANTVSAVQLLICQANANAEVSAGDRVTCSLRRNGLAWCWGSNVAGILGNGSSTATTTSTPVAVSGGHAFSTISVGMTHACAIERTTNAAYCWGMNDVGQLGVSTSQVGFMATTPVAVGGGRAFTSISAGNGVTCGVSNGGALCWGANMGTTPTARGDLSGGISSVSVGNEAGYLGYAYCGIGSAGNVTCRNSYYGATMAQGGTADHFCMLDSSGSASCWGNNYYGELGDSTYSYPAGGIKASPVTVRGDHTFQSIAIGAQATCGLSAGAAFCWGWNQWQQLGTQTGQLLASVPQAVKSPTGTTYIKIAVGYGHACAIDPAGDIWCWGRDDNGQAASVSDPGLPHKVVQTPTI